MPNANLRLLYKNQPVMVQTFGEFRVRCPGQTSSATPTATSRPLQLLKTLIACRHFGNVGYCIETLLWPHVDPKSAKRSLISATHRLRDYLGESRCLQLINGKLALDCNYIWVDAWAFENTLTNMDNTIEDMSAALRLYQGQFLQHETHTPLLFQAQNRLHRIYLDTALKLGKIREQQRQWSEAVTVYRQAIAIDDLAEVCYQALIRCYQQQERYDDIEQIYRRCEASMKVKLSVSPSELTQQLYAQACNKLPT